MQPIFHIVSEDIWRVVRRLGEYRGDTLDTEGFIHCSTAEQVIRTANRVFSGRAGLVVLKIDPTQLNSPLVYEDTSGTGEKFPHIYGPLNVSAVKGFQSLEADSKRVFMPLSGVWLTD